MACSPLEATTTISSPGSRRLPSQASSPAGTRPSADPATSIWRVSTSPDKRRRLAPDPGGSDRLAGPLPPGYERPVARARIPVGGAGGEVGVERERQRPDTAEVVHDGGDGVDADGVPAIEPEGTLDLAGDHRLRPEAFEHDGEREPAELRAAWPARRWKHPTTEASRRTRQGDVPAASSIARRLAASSVS